MILSLFNFFVSFVSAQTFVFKNNYFQFGNLNENSLNIYGQMQQPWYNNNNTWYKLTYYNYPLDFAILNSNEKMYVYSSSVTYQSDDYSNFNIKANISNILYGDGSISSKRIFNNNYFLNYKYTLSDTYILCETSFIPYYNFSNVNVWIGTRDDFVGTSDVNIKTRGNIVNGLFVSSNTSTKAIQVSNNNEAVLFFTTFLNADSAFSYCCDFANVYLTDPNTLPSSTVIPTDGSYAIKIQLGNITANKTYAYTWYYSAGALSTLNNLTQNIQNNVIIQQNKNNIMNVSATSTPMFIITPYPTVSPSGTMNATTFINNYNADTTTATAVGAAGLGLTAVMLGVLASMHIKIPDGIKDKLSCVYEFLKKYGILKRLKIPESIENVIEQTMKKEEEEKTETVKTENVKTENDIEKNIEEEKKTENKEQDFDALKNKFKELLSSSSKKTNTVKKTTNA